MDGNFFFVVGIVLVIAAVGLAFLGIRESDRFPTSRALMVGGIVLFAAVVGTTMAFAVVKSKDEQDKRNAELAKEEPQPEASGTTQATGATGTTGATQTTGATGATETLDVSSPADGGLVFDPNGLMAKPGNVTITYDNPSPVAHSIAVATSNGNVLGEVQPFTNNTESVQLSNIAPGKYVFYCTVPGHREAGMEGDLTVTGGPTP
jgi:plastocyanin